MSRTWNAYAFAIAVLAALVAVPLAPAATAPPVQSAHVKQAVRALVLRGQALDRMYHLGTTAGSSRQAMRALALRGRALDRYYRLGSSDAATHVFAGTIVLKTPVPGKLVHPCPQSGCTIALDPA
jgi:hypothetical protein